MYRAVSNSASNLCCRGVCCQHDRQLTAQKKCAERGAKSGSRSSRSLLNRSGKSLLVDDGVEVFGELVLNVVLRLVAAIDAVDVAVGPVSEFGIAFAKDNTALRDDVQKVLNEMKADGTIAKISEKWFGKDITTIQ